MRVRADAGWYALAAVVALLLGLRYFPMALPGLRQSTYWMLGVAGAVVLFISIVVHELAHLLVARRYGISSRSISLDVLGGRTEVSAALPAPSAEVTMALAGPAANVLLALATWLLLRATEWPAEAAALLRFTALINALLASVNLLPVLPLDGGRLVRALLWSFTGSSARATLLAARIGSVVAIAFVVLGGIIALAGQGFLGLLAIAIGLYLLRRGARFLNPRP